MAQSRAMERSFDPVTLRMFVAVCEERNIARAAEREAIVASAISKRIAAIESELGVQLLESLSVGKSYVRRGSAARRARREERRWAGPNKRRATTPCGPQTPVPQGCRQKARLRCCAAWP